MEPTQRGNLIEDKLAATEYKDWFHVGAENGGKFPLVDFQSGQSLVSLKTADTTGENWIRPLMNHIEALGTRGATVGGEPADMFLDLRVQPGGAAAAQPLIKFGEKFNVTVTIREHP